MSDVYKMDLLGFGKNVLIAYVVFVAAYAIISYIIYTHRYSKARRSLKMYYNNLKKLAYLYDKEGKK